MFLKNCRYLDRHTGLPLPGVMVRLIYLLIIFVPGIGIADELKPFTTDGCSVFPDGTVNQQSLWVNCCIRHDLAYWKGGSYEDKRAADQSLSSCVAEVGEPEIAKIMLAGVRVGGSAYFPTSYRWGYGWSYPRGYQALGNDEKQQVKERIRLFKIIINSISTELETASD